MRLPLQIICLIFLLIEGCGSSKGAVRAGAEPVSASVQAEEHTFAPRQKEEAPPLQAESPLIWVSPPLLDFHFVALSDYSPPVQQGVTNLPAEGYRVQVYSGRESATARRIFAQIRTITGLEAYLNYEAPQYKVRVGDFTNRDDANLLLQQVRRQGFPEAWVVRSTVSLPH